MHRRSEELVVFSVLKIEGTSLSENLNLMHCLDWAVFQIQINSVLFFQCDTKAYIELRSKDVVQSFSKWGQ